jgi:high-affinity K+ transport system ATPase subunit B
LPPACPRPRRWRDALATELVPGDIVQLSLGTVVPADLRIVAGSLLLDQSMLTGESIPAAALANSTEGRDPVDAAIRALAAKGDAPRRQLTLRRFVPFDPTAKMAEAVGCLWAKCGP